MELNYQGPVVQSVVSLTSSLRVISLTVLVDSIHNILIFFAEKMWVAFAPLTNDVVIFEQLGPGQEWLGVNLYHFMGKFR